MAHLSLSMLGPFQATLGGEPVTGFESARARALLAYLAVEADRPHSRDVLAELLWPERPERTARGYLRRALSSLRKALGDRDRTPPFLLITRETIQFNTASDYWLDVEAFRALVETVRIDHPVLQQPAGRPRQWGEAVALYQGSFLEGFYLRDSPAFEYWVLLVRERLQRQASTALHQLTVDHERRDEFEQACEYAWRWVELEPWLEEAHRQVMHLLALRGQRSAALAQYEICRRVLDQELNVEPTAQTTELYKQIRDGQLVPPGAHRPNNVPALLTPLVGRETELTGIKRLLHDPACRLLTLVGPGGIGKTRLALKVAADLVSDTQTERFTHGVYFVPLALLRSTDAIVPAVAQAIGFAFHVGVGSSAEVIPRQQLLSYLRHKDMLLVLDSIEHLLGEEQHRDTTSLVTQILGTAPEIKILVTSRADLNVQGESLFPVAGMCFPESVPPSWQEVMAYSAIRLFVETAQRIRPSFGPTTGNVAHIVQVCRLAQGMPLAILLAGTWIKLLSPTEIAAEMVKGIDFLGTDWQGVEERQRSIRAVFEHSWRLLSEREQEAFQRLSVFSGSFTRQAAQEVAEATLRELLSLAHRSLLQRTPTGRYQIHELLRQFAAEKLALSPTDDERAHNRHAAYYTAALYGWAAELKGPHRRSALAEIDAAGDNVRAAWTWAAEQGQVTQLDRAMDGLCLFYERRGRPREGEAVCRVAADRLEAIACSSVPALSTLRARSDGPVGRLQSAVEGLPPAFRSLLRVWARALAWRALFVRILGDAELTSQLCRQSLTILDHPILSDHDTRLERALVLRQVAGMALSADLGQARALYEQCLSLYRSLNDRWGTADVLRCLGETAVSAGAFDEGKRLCSESLAIGRELREQTVITESLWLLGIIHMYQGRADEAESFALENSALSREMGDPIRILRSNNLLVGVLQLTGRFSEGDRLQEENLAAYNEMGHRMRVAWHTVTLGVSKVLLGLYGEAFVLGQRGLNLCQECGDWRMVAFSYWVLGCVALAEQAWGDAQRSLQQSVDLHRKMGHLESMCWALPVLGDAVRRLGQQDRARQHLHETLRTATEMGAFWPLMFALPVAALLLADSGEQERAVELYALASRYPFVANSRWFEDVAGAHIAAVAAALPPDVAQAARERGRARDLDATVRELLDELSDA